MEKAQAIEKAVSNASEKASLGVSLGSKRKREFVPDDQLIAFDEPL